MKSLLSEEVQIQLLLGTLPYDQKLDLVRTGYVESWVQELLYTDRSWMVRFFIARHPQTADHILQQLRCDVHPSVAQYAEMNLKRRHVA